MVDNSSPPLSVLMPVCNAEAYLARAVESILNQTWRDYEFIIIDDGSTDASLSILQEFAAQDDRIHLISRENRQLVATLNEGISVARSPLIARMDADDVSLPTRLEKQMAFMSEHPEYVACGTQAIWIDSEGLPYYRTSMPLDPDAIDKQHLEGGYCLLHPTWLVRKSALESVGGYSVECRHCEDNDMLLKLGEVGRLGNVDEVLLQYTMHSESLSSIYQMQQWESRNKALKNAWSRRQLEGDPIECPKPSVARVSDEYGRLTSTGWSAWNNKFITTARAYAWRGIWKKPWHKEAWVLLACTLFKNSDTGKWFSPRS